MKKAVFLDRDGVANKAFIINSLPTSPNSFNNKVYQQNNSEFLLVFLPTYIYKR